MSFPKDNASGGFNVLPLATKALKTKSMEDGRLSWITTFYGGPLKLIQQNQQGARELAVKLDCSKSTTQRDSPEIGKSNRCGRWVPHLLSDANKAALVSMAGILLRRVKISGFLVSIHPNVITTITLPETVANT